MNTPQQGHFAKTFEYDEASLPFSQVLVYMNINAEDKPVVILMSMVDDTVIEASVGYKNTDRGYQKRADWFAKIEATGARDMMLKLIGEYRERATSL